MTENKNFQDFEAAEAEYARLIEENGEQARRVIELIEKLASS